VDGLRAQLVHLVEAVPEVLTMAQAVPLALGFGRQLQARRRHGVSYTRLRRWLQAWVSTSVYVTALGAAGSMRHNLLGKPIGLVSDTHRRHARTRLGR
jgi:sRNA-binding protein